MTVIDRPWLFRDDDGYPRFRISWHDEQPTTGPRWPGPLHDQKPFEPHDAQTRALMRRYEELHRLEHGQVVAPLLEEWRWIDQMQGPTEKQKFLRPLIEKVKRAPQNSEAQLVFLLLVCEGVRRNVTRQLVAARSGLEGEPAAPAWVRREEARRINEIERDRLYEVTRQAVLEAIYHCPVPLPQHFFGWLRETVSHRSLDFLRAELSELETAPHHVAEAEMMQAFLAGLETDPPLREDSKGFKSWKLLVRARPLWESVSKFSEIAQVRAVCRTAVDRLPKRQREVIDAHFYEGLEPEQIASECGISRSTVYNTKAQALRNLHDDDYFFVALYSMRLVRDQARKQQITERYPDGVLPDGRRIVVIDQAA